ncbi:MULTISPECIES: hypothetical protein [Trichocoleus]|uniref:Uncharacterized protein n=1 Tax=Trichocoleus desertorum GB2-A4 TaxID=2933944 RepID=A0ABV0JDQ3_9CYAN|nr:MULTISPECIES: hypothetical protein [unclassified Trichocoleus]MBD1861316.1 hypothetical protein [Trichocoleus sp. FACHB-46]MBD2096209.1 hypothetical protein [Trichocoleus sp. FACHB-591]
MTSQLLISTSASSSSSAPSGLEPGEPASSSTAVSEARNRLIESMKKSAYQVDHQVRVLTLQAEAEALLQQLQALKQQRSISELALTHRS